MTVWSVLSEGPSVVLALRREHEGPIVAVKRSVCLNGRLPVAYWANWNRPLDEDKATPPGPVVWTCPRLVKHWRDAGHKCDPDTARNRGELEHWRGRELDRRMYSLHLAVGRCIGAGATKVIVYGADFTGAGNVYAGWAPAEDDRRRKHWEMELSYWNTLVKECRENGVVVERVGYDAGNVAT